MVSRVAAVTFAFWIMEILATTLGETAGDFISMTLNLGYWVGFGVTVALLAAILFAKIREEHYHPVLFWTAIVATTTAGTEISDLMERSLGLGYLWGSVLLTIGLCTTLWLWHGKHRSLSVYPITDRAVELYFWIAVIQGASVTSARAAPRRARRDRRPGVGPGRGHRHAFGCRQGGHSRATGPAP